jgi:Domain of unknown function (DUF6702)
MRITATAFIVLLSISFIDFATALTPSVPSTEASRPVHRFHVSYGRMAVEGNVIAIRARFFSDDLRFAVESRPENEGFVPGNSLRDDSVFVAYFNDHFLIQTADTTLTGTVIGSGEEDENGQMMNWYLVQYRAPENISSLSVTNTLLLEAFDDQKNILKVQHFPSEKTLSFLFEGKNDHFEILLDT